MKYLYETHLHTNVGSACGIADPEEWIPFYKRLGFTGIVITDHFFNGNCRIDPFLPWKERVDLFYSGYERAKAAGDREGLDVFFGWEARLGNDEYLTYGPGKEWLYAHEELVTAGHAEQYRLIHAAGGAVVQAHPCRERDYETAVDLWPDWVDAIEGWNFCDSRGEDERSRTYGKKYGLCLTAGSDLHATSRSQGLRPFGVVSPVKWQSVMDYAKLLRSRTQLELEIDDEAKRPDDFTLHLPVRDHHGEL